MKIPTILATAQIPGELPQQHVPSGGYAHVAAAVSQSAASIAPTLADMNTLEARQRKASATVEADEALDQLKNDHDRTAQEIKDQGTPDSYAERTTAAFDNLQSQAQQSLRYPEAKSLFSQKVSRLRSESAIKARAEGIRLQHAQTASAAQILDREDTSASVFAATPYERQDALDRLAQRDATLVATGVRATTALPQHLADIDKATARRDFDNPGLRAQVIGDLTAGKYRYAPAEAQLELRDSLITKAHTERDAQRKDEDRIKQETADDAQRGIVDAVRGKDWGVANDMLVRYGQYMKGEEKRGWAQYIDKAREDRKSDPQVRTTLSLMTYTADTAATISNARSSVIRAVGAGSLGSEDGDKFLGHLQGMAKADVNRREDKALDAYHKERSEIRDIVKEDLRVTGPLAAIIPQAQTTYAMALDDLNRNVPVDRASGESPRAWYNRTKAQWIGHVTQAAGARMSEIQRAVGFKTKEELNAARGTFRSEADFYDRVRMMRDAEMIQQEVDRMSGKSTAPGEGKSTEKKLGF